MKFFDRITDYVHFRRLDNREKILIIIFIIVLLQFLTFIFIYNPKIQAICSEENNPMEETNKKEEKYNYTGLKDFSENNIKLFLEDTNLKPENISFENTENSEVLKINFNIHRDKLDKIEKILKFYGFKNISLKRIDINTLSVSMESLKNKGNTYYKDIRSEYFNPNNKNKILEEANKEENNNKISEKTIKNTDKIVSKENNMNKNNKSIKSTISTKAEKSSEKKIEDIKKLGDYENIKSQDLIENAPFNKYIDINNINIEFSDTYYKYVNEENNILAIYINEDAKDEFLDIDLKNDYDFLNFDIFIPQGNKKNIGVILKDGLYREANINLEENKWNKLEFNYLNIEKIRIQKSDGESIILVGNIYGK